jgi:hypothetical protein
MGAQPLEPCNGKRGGFVESTTIIILVFPKSVLIELVQTFLPQANPSDPLRAGIGDFLLLYSNPFDDVY